MIVNVTVTVVNAVTVAVEVTLFATAHDFFVRHEWVACNFCASYFDYHNACFFNKGDMWVACK